MIKRKIPTKYNMFNFNWQQLAINAIGRSTPITYEPNERMVVFEEQLTAEEILALRTVFLNTVEEVADL